MNMSSANSLIVDETIDIITPRPRGFTGWQAALSIMTFLCVLMVTRLMMIGRSDQLINCLFAAVLIHHLFWRTMLQWSGEVWPHASSTMTCLILPLAIYLLAVVVKRRNSLCFPKNYQRTA